VFEKFIVLPMLSVGNSRQSNYMRAQNRDGTSAGRDENGQMDVWR